jgi:large subunit ribosomal protein L9
MRVVLLDDIPNLGDAGNVVDVKNGYARNYLIPKRMAEMATRDALNRIELIRKAGEVKRARRMAEAAGKFAVLEGKILVLTMRAGSENRIFGAVTSQLIAEEVQKQFGVTLERRHVMLDDPIKHLGEYTVPLRASAEVTGEVRLTIEAEIKRGGKGGPGTRASREAKPVKAEVPAEEAAPAETPEVVEASEAAETHEKYEGIEEQVEP